MSNGDANRGLVIGGRRRQLIDGRDGDSTGRVGPAGTLIGADEVDVGALREEVIGSDGSLIVMSSTF